MRVSAKIYVASKIYLKEKNKSFKGGTIDNNKGKGRNEMRK